MERFAKWTITWALALFSIILAAAIDSPLKRLIGSEKGNLRPTLSFWLGAFIFFLFGGALVAIILRSEVFETFLTTRRIRKLHDLEEAFGYPFAGSTPLVDDPIGDMADTKSAAFEAMSSITDRIMCDFTDKPPRQILFTSTGPCEGKSSVVFGLAVVLARRGHSVVIVDADFRFPRQHEIFSLSNDHGFSTHAAGNRDLNSIAQKTNVDNLHVITAGPVPPNPTELISSSACRDGLNKLKDFYEVVLIDSAPVLGLADAPSLARLTEFIVYVMRHDHIQPKLALGAFKRIARLTKPQMVLVGTFLNISGRGIRYGYGNEYVYGQE